MTAMDASQLDSMIVRNLGDLDAAAHRILQIERRIWRDLGDLVEAWATRAGWKWYAEVDEVWVAPGEWLVDGEAQAWFSFQWGPNDEGEGLPGEPFFDLCRLSGVAGGRLCLWLDFKGIGARAWKQSMSLLVADVGELGLTLTDKLNAFIDCTPTTVTLADGLLDDDLTTALAPVGRALDLAASAWSLLDTVLTTARKP
jgi:hypothetical protein